MSATVTFIAKIATGHLLRAVRYPDSTNSATTVAYIDSTSDADVVSHVYNAQFEEISRKDQAGNVIDNSYDLNGQLTDRTVSTLASGFDGAVRRIARAYDSLGRTETVTQHNATSGGSVVDQVKYVYDGWRNLTNFQQDKDSTVGASGFWEVEYAFEKKTTGRNTLRRTTIELPGGTTYTYKYRSSGGLHDDDASRVTSLLDSSETAMATYEYSGSGMVVKTTYDEPSSFSKLFSTAATYAGLDAFNRTITSRWIKDSSTDRDFYKVIVG